MVPVLNKIDLPTADIERAKAEIEAVIGIDAEDAVAISAKTGLNVDRGAGGDRPPHPAAEAARYRQAAGADHRLLVRQLPGRGLAGARDAGRDQARRQDPGDVHRPHAPGRQGRRVHAQAQGPAQARRGRSGLDQRLDQGRAWRAGRRHADAGRRSGPQAAAGLPGNAAARVRRPVPGRRRGLPGPARGAGEAAAQRRRAAFRAGKLRGDGLRLPLRLPRHAAHGDRAGAPGARVQPQPDQHRADGDLRSAQDRRHGHADGQPGQAAAGEHDRGDPRADHPRQRPHAAGLRRQRDQAVRGKARRADRHHTTWAARCRSATSCRWPKWCWISSTSSSRSSAATRRWTTTSCASRPVRSCAWTR